MIYPVLGNSWSASLYACARCCYWLDCEVPYKSSSQVICVSLAIQWDKTRSRSPVTEDHKVHISLLGARFRFQCSHDYKCFQDHFESSGVGHIRHETNSRVFAFSIPTLSRYERLIYTTPLCTRSQLPIANCSTMLTVHSFLSSTSFNTLDSPL